MLSLLKSQLRSLPLIASCLRQVRRTFRPNQYDRWQINSQRFEDFLNRTTKTVSNPVFVKVGANDGVSGDPCGRIFLDNAKWTGILIEPVPYLVTKLTENYHDRERFIVEQVAIGNEAGKTQFFYVDESAIHALPDLPVHYDMLGSFDRQHIVNHLNGILEPYVVAVEIEVQTLATVLDRNRVKRIDILQVDTEGYDWEVLKSLDLDRIRPKAIYIEHKHLSAADRESMVTLLETKEFKIFDCGNDFFAKTN